MKLYMLSLMLLSGGVMLGSGEPNQNPHMPIIPRGNVRRNLLSQLSQVPVLPQVPSTFMLPSAALMLPSVYTGASSIPAAATSSSTVPANNQLDGLMGELNRVQNLNAELKQAQNVNDFNSLIHRGASFAKVLEKVCTLGNPELLQAVLSGNKQARFNEWHADPVSTVYEEHTGKKRMDLLKILCADKRISLLTEAHILKEAHRDHQMDVVKLVLFTLQGSYEPDWNTFPSVAPQYEPMYSDMNNMQRLSMHYSPAELKEYRQILIDREGITPEHLMKAAKNGHEYMVKRILYNADNDLLKEIQAPRMTQDGEPAPSIVGQAREYAQENNDNAVAQLFVQPHNVRKLMNEDEHDEFRKIMLEKHLGKQNVLSYVINREQPTQFAVHQKALARQCATLLRNENKKDSLHRISNDEHESTTVAKKRKVDDKN